VRKRRANPVQKWCRRPNAQCMPGRGELQAGTHKKKSAEVCLKPKPVEARFLNRGKKRRKMQKDKKKKMYIVGKE